MTDLALRPGGLRPCPLAGQHELMYTFTQLSYEPANPIINLTPVLGSLGPGTRIQSLTLPSSSLAVIPGHGFTRQRVSNSPGVFWTLTLP